MRNTATLLIQCIDAEGILATVCNFIYKHHGNITSLQEHVELKEDIFFSRIEWNLNGFELETEESFHEAFQQEIANQFQMNYTYHLSKKKRKVAIFVSKYTHCIEDVLYRYSNGELDCEIPVIISNHHTLKYIADRYEIPFVHLPITKANKKEQEQKQFEILENAEVDLVVLARYMQILSNEFTTRYANRMINIHHSFLPAFTGAKPYHAAFKRGVKIIGATAHFVTADLDEGPIISQDIAHITHRDSIEDMVVKGRDIEKLVFSKAIKLFLENKVLAYNNRTVVFS